MKKLWLLLVGFLIVVCGLGGVIFYVSFSTQNLPSYDDLLNYNPSATSKLYSLDGKLINSYAIENRIFVPIDKIPLQLKQAFLAAEDKSFYSNKGIDPLMIMRAAFINFIGFVKGQDVLVGGSTITQQVVKNLILSNERTLTRKIKEAVISYKITNLLSKDKILEIYLNQIYLGRGAYGVLAASKTYFGKSLNELTLREIAMIASMPKAPSALDRVKQSNRLNARVNWVLEQMFINNFITLKEMQNAKTEELVFQSQQQFKQTFGGGFSSEVKSFISYKYGANSIFNDGLTVQTTLNSFLQSILTESFRNGIEEYEKRHSYRGVMGNIKPDKMPNWCDVLKSFAKDLPDNDRFEVAVVLSIKGQNANVGFSSCQTLALPFSALKYEGISDIQFFKNGDVILLKKTNNDYTLSQIPEVNGGAVVINNSDGKVLAMIGDYFDNQNSFNRVTQAKRQPGSAFKSFVYLAALENNYSPAYRIADVDVELSKGKNNGTWVPKNYNGKSAGLVSLRYALENSLNIPTVRLGEIIGVKKISDLVKRLGIMQNPPTDLSIVLGAYEVRMLDLMKAYTIIANGGKKVEPYFIEYIQDKDGNVIYSKYIQDYSKCKGKSDSCGGEQLIDPQSNYQLISILEGVLQNGSGKRIKRVINQLGIEAGGKTGTTNDAKDSWFILITPQYSIGVYVGFDKPKSLGTNEFGGTIALPIVADFIRQIPHSKDRFPVPSGLKVLRVNRKTGSLASDSESANVINEFFKETNDLPAKDKDEIDSFSMGLGDF